MKFTLESNSNNENHEIVPYYIHVDIEPPLVNTGPVLMIPVKVRYRGVSKTYVANICGFEITNSRPETLIDKLERFLPRLIALSRLPTYMFVARRAKSIYPVYTAGDEVFATIRGGPAFRHVELAKVREYLTDYLHSVGILGELGLSDKLHVRGINMHTLELRRPIFYLKKRIPGEVDFWAPVFESADMKRIYAYAASERREAPKTDGMEVLLLQKLVASALIQDNRLKDLYDLRPGRLFPENWEHLKGNLIPQEPINVRGIELPTYTNGDIMIALETRPEENRYSLYLGANINDLTQRAMADFARRGITQKH